MGCTSSQAEITSARARAQDLARDVGALGEGQALDMRAITMMMWKARNLPELVEALSDLLATHADEKEVFDGIEFYLPQLLHMILHLEIKWDTKSLESFVLMISQQSLHLALQMNWILVASMQDYQPEDDEGKPNPSANPELFLRCASLMHNLERCVVFGSPRCAEYEQRYHEGKITKEELQELAAQDRKFAAKHFIEEGASRAAVLQGPLFYKRWNRVGRLHTKGWRPRYFRIQHRVLLCYLDEKYEKLERAIPLSHTEVSLLVKHDKHPYYFELREVKRERVYKLYATNQQEMDQWVKMLRQEANSPPVHLPTILSTKTLTQAQIARYGFYRSEREFTRALTDICEELRFVPRENRKPELKDRLESLEIPGCVYLPMSRSTAPWYRVLRVLPDKGHPFSTRKRCPCLMTFEVLADGPDGIDVANFLYQTLGAHGSLDEHELEVSVSAAASADWKRKFNKSARKSVTEKMAPTAPASGDAAAGRLEIAFSDADVGETPGGRDGMGPKKISLWDSEATPNALNRKAPSEASSAGSSSMSAKKLMARQQMSQRAMGVLQSSVAGSPLITIQKGAAAGAEIPVTPIKTLVGEPKTLSEAIGQASEDDRRTPSVRIKSMARNAQGGSVLAGGGDGHGGGGRAPMLDRIIAKSNDDLRQEVFTMQLLTFLKETWDKNNIPLYLRTYRILSTSKMTGLLEVITNADSIDGIKKKLGPERRFVEKFREAFPEPERFAKCQRAYMESLAGSSLACYILRIGDRHNGNIMVEMEEGRLAHIDFGFVLGMRPGKDKIPYTDFSLERAAFKLTSEMVEVMGGLHSELFEEMIKIMSDGLIAIRREAETLVTLLEITGFKSMFPCFRQPGGGVSRVIRELKERLFLDLADDKIPAKMRHLVESSYMARGTILYEWFQERSNGLAPIY